MEAQSLGRNIAKVLDAIPSGIEPTVAVLFLLSLPDRPSVRMGPEEEAWSRDLLEQYTLNDLDLVRQYISHRFTHLLPDRRKSSLGKYYSPPGAIRHVRSMVLPFLDKPTRVLDICVGCGAFAFEFEPYEFWGFDIDPVAVEILKAMGHKQMACKNSLELADRSAFGIPVELNDMIIVGNPPYNNRNSKNRRGSKDQFDGTIDKRVDSADLGVSFMRMYFLLRPKAVAVLHPMSYLLKPTIYQKIANFGYQLQSCTVFSSKAFATHGSKAFPYCAALWVPRDPEAQQSGKELPRLSKAELEAEWQALRQKSFDVIEIDGEKVSPVGATFRMTDYTTIDDPAHSIRKYALDEKSDIDLYCFNFRDLNSLQASGNFTNKLSHTVPVNLGEDGSFLFRYCALNAIKRRWKQGQKPLDFILGNMSPIYPIALIETPLRFACLIDAYFSNEPKFQPGFQLFSPWVQQLTRNHPDQELLRRFVQIIEGEATDRDQLVRDCAQLVQSAINSLR